MCSACVASTLICSRSFPVYTAIQGIIDATNDQLKEIENNCAENNDVRTILILHLPLLTLNFHYRSTLATKLNEWI